jgi:hypothetical protein
MSLYLFDHEVTTVYENVPIENVEPLTLDTFVPRGSTALLDAMGHVLKKDTLTQDTCMIILTDGDENASKKYTSAHIKDLVENKTKNDNWTFMYLGANQDVIMSAERIGLSPAQTLSFDTRRTPELFQALSQTMSANNNLPASP